MFNFIVLSVLRINDISTSVVTIFLNYILMHRAYYIFHGQNWNADNVPIKSSIRLHLHILKLDSK